MHTYIYEESFCYLCICTCIRIYIYIYTYICMLIYINIYIYIYIYVTLIENQIKLKGPESRNKTPKDRNTTPKPRAFRLRLHSRRGTHQGWRDPPVAKKRNLQPTPVTPHKNKNKSKGGRARPGGPGTGKAVTTPKRRSCTKIQN